MIDTKELRRLAEEQQWIGRWYDAGCETLMAERNGEHEEVAHPMPIGLVPYLVAVQPAAITSLLDRLEAAESECLEQARINGMGSEREAALMAKLEAAEKERDNANAIAVGIALQAKRLEEDRAIDTQRMAILVAELNGAERERDALRAENEALSKNLRGKYATTGATYAHLIAERDALRTKIEAAEKSDAESIAMYRKARDERDELRTELREVRYGAAVAHDVIKTLQAKIAEMEKQWGYVPAHQQADPIKDEREAFREWFEGEQGIAYDGLWSFAKAAWLARAALGAKL